MPLAFTRALRESEKRAVLDNPNVPETLKYRYNTKMPSMDFNKQRFVLSTSEQTCFLLFFFRTAFFINVFPQTRAKREKPNWQNTFPADALCAYSTVSLPVSLSSLRIATGVSLSTGVGNSSNCT